MPEKLAADAIVITTNQPVSAGLRRVEFSATPGYRYRLTCPATVADAETIEMITAFVHNTLRKAVTDGT